MTVFIIKKWIEPYLLLETVKKYYSYSDYDFDAVSKNLEKNKFLRNLSQNKNSVGLYMKNVNKYYFFSPKESIDILSVLTEKFNFSSDDILSSQNLDEMFEMVDLGKAEAGLILSL